MTDTNSSDTKEQIINVAERLFAENGFAGTSLRSVIREANVNLSAVNYHFGSKEGLYSAVISRTAKPIVEEELKRLRHYQKKQNPPSVEMILEALLTPVLEKVIDRSSDSMSCARFMGRCRTEPDGIRDIADNEFKDSQEAFLDALGRSLPPFIADRINLENGSGNCCFAAGVNGGKKARFANGKKRSRIDRSDCI